MIQTGRGWKSGLAGEQRPFWPVASAINSKVTAEFLIPGESGDTGAANITRTSTLRSRFSPSASTKEPPS